MPTPHSGAIEPLFWVESTKNVAMPAIDVTNVAASVAGATSRGERPKLISSGARIEPPPMP